MKKRLGKSMPHVPLLKLKPELAEQDKNDQETETTEDTDDDGDVNGQGDIQFRYIPFQFQLFVKRMFFWRKES